MLPFPFSTLLLGIWCLKLKIDVYLNVLADSKAAAHEGKLEERAASITIKHNCAVPKPCATLSWWLLGPHGQLNLRVESQRNHKIQALLSCLATPFGFTPTALNVSITWFQAVRKQDCCSCAHPKTWAVLVHTIQAELTGKTQIDSSSHLVCVWFMWKSIYILQLLCPSFGAWALPALSGCVVLKSDSAMRIGTRFWRRKSPPELFELTFNQTWIAELGRNTYWGV